MFPLSRTSAWLASRSSFARRSREECSFASFVCKDLYKFTLELTPVKREQKAVITIDMQAIENNKTRHAPHVFLDLEQRNENDMGAPRRQAQLRGEDERDLPCP
jgi:hypothetical protein